MDNTDINLINSLRADAKDVKDCFTKFSFQAIAFSSAILGIIARYQSDHPPIALASISIVLLLIAVARIGTYKYGSANRQYGYELHLSRTMIIEDSSKDGWKGYMRKIGWEEAMRAWRIVQATAFERLYYSSKWFPNFLRCKYRKENYRWFDTESLIKYKRANKNKSIARYHAGSYLRTMNSLLHCIALISTIPLIIMVIQINSNKFSYPEYVPVISIIIPIILIIVILFRILKDFARRRLLETGILSIHSCSIMWQAVVLSHYKTLEDLHRKNCNGYKHYTEILTSHAEDLAKNIFKIHEWISGEISIEKENRL